MSSDNEADLTMTVSPVCTKNGEKVAFVSFSDSHRKAEWSIPDCRLVMQEGFDRSEIEQLEKYLRGNMGELKKKAASLNVVNAIMGDGHSTQKGT